MVLAGTGVDIHDPALSWQERYDLCARALPEAWQDSLKAALLAQDNERLFGHKTIEPAGLSLEAMEDDGAR